MTIGGSRFVIRLVLTLLCTCCSFHIFAGDDTPGVQRQRVSDMGLSPFGFSTVNSPALTRIKLFESVEGAIDRLEGKIILTQGAVDAAQGAAKQKLAKKLLSQQNMLTNLERNYASMADSKIAAYRLLVGGLAGKDAKGYIDEFNQVDNIGDAIKQGLAFRFAKGVGDVLGKRITAACEFFLGGTCDFVIHQVLGLWGDITSVLFHDSKDPMTIDILKQWQFLVKRSLEDIERLLKDGMKDTLRGYDMTKRRMDSLTVSDDDKPGSSKAGDGSLNAELDNIWLHLSNTYSDVFEMIIEEIDFRKGYYDEESMAVRHANSIKRLLVVLSKSLQTSTSIADFDSKVGSTKALIPAIRKELDNLFLALIEQVKPPTYSLKAKESAFDGLGRKRAKTGYGYGSDSDYGADRDSWG